MPITSENGIVKFEFSPSEAFDLDMRNAIAAMEARLAKPRWGTTDMDPVALRRELINPIEDTYAAQGAMTPAQLAAYKLRVEKDLEEKKLAQAAKEAADSISLKNEMALAKKLAAEQAADEKATLAEAKDKAAMERLKLSLESKANPLDADTLAKLDAGKEPESAWYKPWTWHSPWNPAPAAPAAETPAETPPISSPIVYRAKQPAVTVPELKVNKPWEIKMVLPSGETVTQRGGSEPVRTPRTTTATARVRMRSPEGKIGTLPASQVDAAIAEGWERL